MARKVSRCRACYRRIWRGEYKLMYASPRWVKGKVFRMGCSICLGCSKVVLREAKKRIGDLAARVSFHWDFDRSKYEGLESKVGMLFVGDEMLKNLFTERADKWTRAVRALKARKKSGRKEA